MVVSEIHAPSSPARSRHSAASSSSSSSSQGNGVYRRTISRSSSRSTRRRAKPESSETSTGSKDLPPSGHIRRDSQRFTERSRASSLPRPQTATVKSSRSRILPNRASESSRTQAVHTPEKPTVVQKQPVPVTSKDILVYLYKAWQPQLCASYRKSVPYQPTDPLQMQVFMDALLRHKDNSQYYLDKFKAVGRLAQVVSMLKHHDHVDDDERRRSPTNNDSSSSISGGSQSSSSQTPYSLTHSSSQSVCSNDSHHEKPSLPSIPREKLHVDVFNNEHLSQCSDEHPGYSQSFESTTDKLPYYQHRRSVDHVSIDLTPKTKKQLLLKSYSDGNFNTV